jgi:phosphomannomutase
MKKLLIFDLDGTLAESKCPLSNDMASILEKVLDYFSIAVISGGSYPQFEKQFLGNLPITESKLEKLYLFPTCATSFYRYQNGWQKIYAEDLSEEHKSKIFQSFHQMFQQVGLSTDNSFGPVLEDRSTQITFSALGQQAPVELKKQWDPDHSKRLQMVDILKTLMPEFEIRTGGSTSIDVTRKGIDDVFPRRRPVRWW